MANTIARLGLFHEIPEKKKPVGKKNGTEKGLEKEQREARKCRTTTYWTEKTKDKLRKKKKERNPQKRKVRELDKQRHSHSHNGATASKYG